MRNSPNLSFSLNVVLKRIKLHSVHSALDVERFREGLCKVRKRTADADGGQRTADGKKNKNK